MLEQPLPKYTRADEAQADLHDRQVRAVELQFTDVMGMIKSVTIDLDFLPAAVEAGVWFDGSAVESFARVAESDMYLLPDLSTLAVLPWEPLRPDVGRTARVFCDVYTPNAQPFAGDPRGALRRAVEAAAQQGVRYCVAPELEYYIFRDPPGEGPLLADDQASYFDASDGAARVIRKRAGDALRAMGVVVESSHHEVGGGQHELDLAPLDALQAADAIVTARMAVRTIARQEGRFASFMPKPITNAPGSGMHVHQWLASCETGENVFTDPAHDYGLSAEGQHFLAGQLAHAREMCAVLAPLVNSYRRLMAGLEAPIYVTWAQLNRGALVRVPRLAEGQQTGTRIEMRAPDPSCNPYLAFAVLLQAGLRGMRDELPLPPAADEELYEVSNRRRHLTTLPASLDAALEELESSELAREALGLHLYERFLEAKRLEWQDYLLVVSPWELERYLGIY
ncbi:MAG: glutamine synthetase family protein [Anaerolineae bacterium]|nr:glutamine synthetase family protein [Anaerolineae bacterium]